MPKRALEDGGHRHTPMPPEAQAAEPDQLGDGLVVLHRSRFIEWQPAPIVALTSSADGSLTVAARENGDLELYEASTLQCFQRIPGSKHASTTCVALVDEADGASCRLFTAGLDGSICEVDLEQRRAAAATDSYGGAVWQLALEPAATQPAAPQAAAPKANGSTPNGAQPHAEQPAANGAAAAGLDRGSSDDDDDDDDDAGGAAAVASPRLAAACDDGCVRLFAIDPGVPGASYLRSLPRVEGRVLAVAWHPTGRYIVSGGTDGCIHVWDVAAGRELLRITAGDGSGRDACIWALAVLPDGTVVSGDASGNVSFWDAQFGTLLARVRQHSAAVLQLAVSPDGATVFAAGVDPQVAVVQRVKGPSAGPKREWVYLSAKRPHTHDVRAMCVAHGRHAGEAVLWTGGNDTLLMTHPVDRFLKEHPTRVEACPQRPLLQAVRRDSGTSSSAGWLLCAQAAQLDLWQLGAAQASAQEAAAGAAAAEGSAVAAAAAPRHLARLLNRSGDFIVAAALSSDGRHVAFSDAHRVRCFAVAEDTAAGSAPAAAASRAPLLAVSPVLLPTDLPVAAYLGFQPGSNNLVCLATDGTVRLVCLPGATAPSGGGGGGGGGGEEGGAGRASGGGGGGASVVHTIRELHDLRYKMWYKRDRGRSAARAAAPAVGAVALSADGRWLAAAVRGRVQLLGLDAHRIAAQLPPAPDHSPPAALAFTSDSAAVVVVSASNQVLTYEVPGGQPSEWTLRNAASLPRRLLDLPGPLSGVAVSPAAPAAVLLFSAEAVCHVDFGRPPGQEASRGRKQRRRERVAKAATPAGHNCRALYCTDPVLHVQYLSGTEVLVVERAWADVWRGLPPPMYRHRYGT